MSELTIAALRQQLEADIRSGGREGLTTAEDVRHFLGSLLTELDTLENTQAAQALAGRRIAEAITQDFVRTAYPDAQAAIDGAGDHGTATVYSLAYGAVAAGDPTTTVPGVTFPNNTLITNLQGLALRTPDANTDVLTFTGGTQVVNANHTTIVCHPVRKNSGIGWTVTAHTDTVQDVTIHDLHLVVQNVRTHALYFASPGRYQFSGSIKLGQVAFWPEQNYYYRWGVYNQRGTFVGRGTIEAYGTDATTVGTNARGLTHVLFAVGANATTTWEGNVQVYDDVVNTLSTNATLVLREGVLNAQGRTPGMAPLFGAAAAGSTIILENYTLLVRPEEEALHADTVILRGNSVVVGTISAAHLIDERPASAGGATGSTSTADVVHLEGAETITGLKTFTGPVQAAAFVGDGAQLTNLPSQTVLEFAFTPGAATSLTTSLTTDQAGHYTVETGTNLDHYTLTRNGQPVADLPLTLAAGDVLAVSIARQDDTQAARLILQAGTSRRYYTFYGSPAAYVPTALLRTDGRSGLRVPAIAGAVAVAFWLRATDNGQYGSFLVDFRTHGTGYWWGKTSPVDFGYAGLDGQAATSYAPVFAPGWHKVYLEFATLAQGFSLLSRHTDTEFFYPCDIADITFYDRPFTDAEKADATGALPAAGVLAHYTQLAANRGSVVDRTGRHDDLVLVGAPLTDGQPRVWVHGASLASGLIQQWPNLGYAGATHTLLPAASKAPIALRDAQNGCSFARFEGNDWLTTSGLLGLPTPDVFSVVLVFRVHRKTAAGTNLLGWGLQQQGKMFDLYQGGSQGDQLSADYYGPGNTLCNPGGLRPGHWQVLHLTNGGLQQPFLDGVSPGPANAATSPADSPLWVGAGQWPNLNNPETIDIAECRIYDNANGVSHDRPALLAELARTYSGGVSQQDYPMDAAAWSLSPNWSLETAASRTDIRMTLPTGALQYSAVQPDTHAEFTFGVGGEAAEGVRVYGTVENSAQLDVYLDGVRQQTIAGGGYYTNITGTLCEFFNLAAGTHTVRLVKTQGDGGEAQGVLLGGATVFCQVVSIL